MGQAEHPGAGDGLVGEPEHRAAQGERDGEGAHDEESSLAGEDAPSERDRRERQPAEVEMVAGLGPEQRDEL